FARNQEEMRKYMHDALGGLFPFGQFEEMGKQNMALFERAMKMFSPFPADQQGGEPGAKPAEGGAGGDIDTLKDRLNALQREIDQLTKKR
ncbi:MAG: polyhydroxyalkanoate synthesis repressor PhaR, partial [Rhodospirillales bacterium]|nr:polyhydroxyalkanoate synthesis repressor PhaR [Rhodospirillales bacterium]